MHTDDYVRVELEEADSELFGGVSFASKAGIDDGTEANTKNLRSKFAQVAEPIKPQELELATTALQTFKGPKSPG